MVAILFREGRYVRRVTNRNRVRKLPLEVISVTRPPIIPHPGFESHGVIKVKPAIEADRDL